MSKLSVNKKEIAFYKIASQIHASIYILKTILFMKRWILIGSATLNYESRLRMIQYLKLLDHQVKVAMTYKHLSQEERNQIYILMSAGNNQQQIAELLANQVVKIHI